MDPVQTAQIRAGVDALAALVIRLDHLEGATALAAAR